MGNNGVTKMSWAKLLKLWLNQSMIRRNLNELFTCNPRKILKRSLFSVKSKFNGKGMDF